jgi:hypothetical protein
MIRGGGGGEQPATLVRTAVRNLSQRASVRIQGNESQCINGILANLVLFTRVIASAAKHDAQSTVPTQDNQPTTSGITELAMDKDMIMHNNARAC